MSIDILLAVDHLCSFGTVIDCLSLVIDPLPSIDYLSGIIEQIPIVSDLSLTFTLNSTVKSIRLVFLTIDLNCTILHLTLLIVVG